ncbi:hypothetical protein JW968_04795 [Candidatus Woesearchaeota archaeon]|nr:hypothetical protein [Candidatus Woesearchaeota archaeon]
MKKKSILWIVVLLIIVASAISADDYCIVEIQVSRAGHNYHFCNNGNNWQDLYGNNELLYLVGDANSIPDAYNNIRWHFLSEEENSWWRQDYIRTKYMGQEEFSQYYRPKDWRPDPAQFTSTLEAEINRQRQLATPGRKEDEPISIETVTGSAGSPIISKQDGPSGGTGGDTSPPSSGPPSSVTGLEEKALKPDSVFSGNEIGDLMGSQGIDATSLNLVGDRKYNIRYENGEFKVYDTLDQIGKPAGEDFDNYMFYRRTEKNQAQIAGAEYQYGLSADDKGIRIWTNINNDIDLKQDGFRLPEGKEGEFKGFKPLSDYKKGDYLTFSDGKQTDNLMMTKSGDSTGQIWGHQTGDTFQLSFYGDDGRMRQIQGKDFQPAVSTKAMDALKGFEQAKRGELDNTLAILEKYGFSTSDARINNAIIGGNLGFGVQTVDNVALTLGGGSTANFASITTEKSSMTLPDGRMVDVPGGTTYVNMGALTGNWQETYKDRDAMLANIPQNAVITLQTKDGPMNFLIGNSKNNQNALTMIPVGQQDFGAMNSQQTINSVLSLNSGTANSGYGIAGNTVFDLRGGTALGNYINLQGAGGFKPGQIPEGSITWTDDKGNIWVNRPATGADGTKTGDNSVVGQYQSYGAGVNRITPTGGNASYTWTDPKGNSHDMTDVDQMFAGGAHVDSEGNFFMPPNEQNPNGVSLDGCKWSGGSRCTMDYGDTSIQVNCGANGCSASYHGFSQSYLGIGAHMTTMSGTTFNGQDYTGDLMGTAKGNAQSGGGPCSSIGNNTWCYYDHDFILFDTQFCTLKNEIYACGSNTTYKDQYGLDDYNARFGSTPSWSAWLTNIGQILSQWIEATSGYPNLEGFLYDPAEEEAWIDFSAQEWGYLLYGIQGWSSQICQVDNPVSDTDQYGFAFSADSMLGASAHIEAERTTFYNYSDEDAEEMYLYKLSFSVNPGTCYLDFEVDAKPLFYEEYDHEEMIDPDEDEEGESNETIELMAAVGGRTMQPSVSEFIINTSTSLITKVCINFKDMDPENCFGNDMGPGSHLCREVNDGDQYEEGWHEEQYGY